ncbi:enoyl-CoA delta isomerase [Acrasis kona]|uniref:3-hydroxypropionyl-coenzyme A dehydratase n=1 Tax=Acrasis kona TaxID=1008807 RepID=A0AAW2YL12_9EUKA
MSDYELTEKDNVFVLTLKLGNNVFNPNLISNIGQALDKVEKSEGPKALVITAEDKFFSNGLDLKYLSKAGSEDTLSFFQSIADLLCRILVFPVITIAAINGHAFGAGAFLALSCDFRIMQNEKGFLCFPEVDLGLPLSDTFRPLVQGKLNNRVAAKAVLTGKRFSAEEALKDGIVDQTTKSADLLPTAFAMAKSLASKGANRSNLTELKKEVYDHTYRGLTGPRSVKPVNFSGIASKF